MFNDGKCSYHSDSYYCQPVKKHAEGYEEHQQDTTPNEEDVPVTEIKEMSGDDHKTREMHDDQGYEEGELEKEGEKDANSGGD